MLCELCDNLSLRGKLKVNLAKEALLTLSTTMMHNTSTIHYNIFIEQYRIDFSPNLFYISILSSLLRGSSTPPSEKVYINPLTST